MIDTLALADVLDPSSRAQCYFGVWSGWGSLISVREDVDGEISSPSRYGSIPTVELPWRSYELFVGESAGVVSFITAGRRFLSANIWWAADRSWFVATEIDLSVTYVGGSRELIDRLLQDRRLEVTRSGADFSIMRRFPRWLGAVIDAACEEVIASGTTKIALSMGTVGVTYERRGWRHGWIRTRSERALGGGYGGGGGRVSTGDSDVFRASVRSRIESAVYSLVA
jgi:hypothetical protein